MNLQEEYLRRHLIQAPIIKYVKEGYLILRTKDSPKIKWVVFHITEQPQANHPNDSYLLEMVPNYNGYSSKGLFANSNKILMNFDNYESTLLGRLSAHKKNGYLPIFGVAETRIALTEMFIYGWCDYIADTYKDKAINYYFNILNTKKDIEERMVYVEKMNGIFVTDVNGMSDSWKICNRYICPDLYCSWLKSWEKFDV